jgi:hypothetical protein
MMYQSWEIIQGPVYDGTSIDCHSLRLIPFVNLITWMY